MTPNTSTQHSSTDSPTNSSPPSNSRKAFTYARLGPDEKGPSIELQIGVAAAHAKLEGFNEIEEIVDEGVAGNVSMFGRAGLRKALVALASGEAEALAVSGLDRISKDLAIVSMLSDCAQSDGWQLIIPGVAMVNDVATGRFVMGLLNELSKLAEAQNTKSTTQDAGPDSTSSDTKTDLSDTPDGPSDTPASHTRDSSDNNAHGSTENLGSLSSPDSVGQDTHTSPDVKAQLNPDVKAQLNPRFDPGSSADFSSNTSTKNVGNNLADYGTPLPDTWPSDTIPLPTRPLSTSTPLPDNILLSSEPVKPLPNNTLLPSEPVKPLSQSDAFLQADTSQDHSLSQSEPRIAQGFTSAAAPIAQELRTVSKIPSQNGYPPPKLPQDHPNQSPVQQRSEPTPPPPPLAAQPPPPKTPITNPQPKQDTYPPKNAHKNAPTVGTTYLATWRRALSEHAKGRSSAAIAYDFNVEGVPLPGGRNAQFAEWSEDMIKKMTQWQEGIRILDRAIAEHEQDRSLAQIAKDLNSDAMYTITGKRWSAGSLRELLSL